MDAVFDPIDRFFHAIMIAIKTAFYTITNWYARNFKKRPEEAARQKGTNELDKNDEYTAPMHKEGINELSRNYKYAGLMHELGLRTSLGDLSGNEVTQAAEEVEMMQVVKKPPLTPDPTLAEKKFDGRQQDTKKSSATTSATTKAGETKQPKSFSFPKWLSLGSSRVKPSPDPAPGPLPRPRGHIQ